MPSNVFSGDLRVNSAVYIGDLKSVVKPRRDGACNGRPYVFHQDSAPSQSQLTQKWMTEYFHGYITPYHVVLCSTNFSLSDNYVWSVVKR